jgi:hypothetical protein
MALMVISLIFDIRLFILGNMYIVAFVTFETVWMMSLPMSSALTIFLVSIAVKMRLKELNGILVKNFRRFKTVARLYLRLIEMIQVVNTIYGFLIPMLLLSSLLQSAFSSYELLGLFVQAENGLNRQRLGFAMLITSFNVFLTSTFTLIIAATSSTVNEARKTLEICCKIRRQLKNDGNLKILMLQLCHTRDIVFGCGMFNYNWPLVFNYLTAMMSYLMIFIQFDKSLMK